MRISDWSSDVCSSDRFDQRVCQDIGDDEVIGRAAAQAAVGHPIGDDQFDPAVTRAQRYVIDCGILDRDFDRDRVDVGRDRAPAERARRGKAEDTGAGAKIKDIAVARARASEPVEHSEARSEEHTSELQSLLSISYAVFSL